MTITIKPADVIVLPVVRKIAPELFVQSTLDGRVLARRFFGYGANERGWQIEAIASFENCNASDLVFHEGDENGPDRYTLNGEVVATVEVN